MYPGQYQNFAPPQVPSTASQQIGGVQHVLVPTGWQPPPQQHQHYYIQQAMPVVAAPPPNTYYVPASNPYAVQGMTYSVPVQPVQYVFHQVPVTSSNVPPTARLMELRRTASDGPGAFSHIVPQAPVYGVLSNSVGSNYHQRYMRQFQNFQVQQQPQPAGVYMIPQGSPRQPQAVLTASVSPQPSASANHPRAASRPPQPTASSSSSSSSANRPAPVVSQVLDEDPQPFLPPYEEILREGWLNFSASNDRFLPFWMILYKDFLVCLDTNSRPLWKITLWGTSVETVPQSDGKRFAILSGYGQTFWFEGESSEEAAEWIKILRTEVYQPARPAAPSSSSSSLSSASRPQQPAVASPIPLPSSPKPAAASSPVAIPSASAAPNALSPSGRRSQSGFFGFLSTLFTDTNDEELRHLCQVASAGSSFASAEQSLKIRRKLEQNLSTSVHSLGRAIEKFVAAYKKSHSEAEDEKQFAAAVAELLAFIREMSNQIMTVYPFLSEIDNVDQICHEAVELSLTPKLYLLLSTMYQRRYRAEDAAHSKKISEFLTVTPGHLGIRKLFWLLRTASPFPPASSSSSSSAGGHKIKKKSSTGGDDEMLDETPPYYAAIRHLKSLPSMTSGHDKVTCLIETGKIICQCVKQFWEGQVDPMKLVVGADDLVPIFTYVIIKANVPHLHADAAMIQDLMSEKAAMEVGGYSLATLQTCLQHITMLERQEVMKAAEDAAAQIDKRETAITPASGSQIVAQLSTPPPATAVSPSTVSSVAPGPSSLQQTRAELKEEDQLAPTFSLEKLAAAIAPPELKPAPPSSSPTSLSPAPAPVTPTSAASTATSPVPAPAPVFDPTSTSKTPTKSDPDLISFE